MQTHARGRPTDKHWREARSRRTQSADVGARAGADGSNLVENTLREIRTRGKSRDSRATTRMSCEEIDQLLSNIRRASSTNLSRPPPPTEVPPRLPKEDFLPFGCGGGGGGCKNPADVKRKHSSNSIANPRLATVQGSDPSSPESSTSSRKKKSRKSSVSTISSCFSSPEESSASPEVRPDSQQQPFAPPPPPSSSSVTSPTSTSYPASPSPSVSVLLPNSNTNSYYYSSSSNF